MAASPMNTLIRALMVNEHRVGEYYPTWVSLNGQDRAYGSPILTSDEV